MDGEIEKAYEQFEKWVSRQPSMWNVRHETEYKGQFADEDGTVCSIFRYRKMPGGSWTLGIVSDSRPYSIHRTYEEGTRAEDAELTLHYLKRELQREAMRDEMMEKYKDYRRGTYQGMSLREKMEFMAGIQQDFIPGFDGDGFEMDTWMDFHSIQKEWKENPQMFALEDMVTLLHMMDDQCFEPDMMHQLVIIIRRIAVHNGTEGVCFLLEHLNEVPREGRWHGQFRLVQWMMTDEYFALLKEAVAQCAPTGRELLLGILGSYGFVGQEERVEELKALCAAVGSGGEV
ncbi:MAG: hypothetical protein NC420_03675 [Eubacterium sp.]|nr:hypothetical protein [Eubacterium sp.]